MTCDEPEKQSPLAEVIALRMGRRFVHSAIPGTRLPSVRKLARLLDVSIPTVRAAQTILSRRGEVEIRHGSGVYVPADEPRKRIGIVSELDLLAPRISAYFTLTASKLKTNLREQGFRPELYVGDSQPGDHRQKPTCERFVEDVHAGRLAGLVMLDAPETSTWATFMEKLTIPAVGALTPFPLGPTPSRLVETGVQELQEQGCRRIAMLTWAQAPANLYKAVAVRGLETRREWVRSDLHPQHAGAGWEEFREIWTAHPEKPDGLLIGDDLLMQDAAEAILELGIQVPRKLRVITHSNRGSNLRIPLPVTRIVQDPDDCARRFVNMLMRLMAGEKLPAGAGDVPLSVEHCAPNETIESCTRENIKGADLTERHRPTESMESVPSKLSTTNNDERTTKRLVQ